MNLPNKLTTIRVIMIPFFVLAMEIDALGAWGRLIAALIFVLASVTDALDGHFARKYNMITDLGKFLDPLADKLLVSAALIVLVDLDLMYGQSWIAIVIISREFAVTGLRLVLAGTGEVVAANQLGKIKTWAQIVSISALLLHNLPFALISLPFANIALWIALIFTIWSGLDYFIKNKEVFVNSK